MQRRFLSAVLKCNRSMEVKKHESSQLTSPLSSVLKKNATGRYMVLLCSLRDPAWSRGHTLISKLNSEFVN